MVTLRHPLLDQSPYPSIVVKIKIILYQNHIYHLKIDSKMNTEEMNHLYSDIKKAINKQIENPTLTGLIIKLRPTGGLSPLIVSVPTTTADKIMLPTSWKLSSLLRNNESVMNTE